MGADDSANVKALKAPALIPISIPTRLADAPTEPPKYAVTVQDRAGAEVIVADPNATRAAVALMNVHAVVGGARSCGGGPAAAPVSCPTWDALTGALLRTCRRRPRRRRRPPHRRARRWGSAGRAARGPGTRRGRRARGRRRRHRRRRVPARLLHCGSRR